MSKLLLVDGSAVLTTSFFGNAPLEYKTAKTNEDKAKASEKLLKTSDGVFTNGVFTMIENLLKLIKSQKPSHVAVAWDLNRDTWRRQLYSGYKANREDTRPELKSQYAVAQEVLREMNISQFVFQGWEADDIIGTLAHQFKAEIPVRILTKDQDALQLVDDNVRLWYMTKQWESMYKQVGLDARSLGLPYETFEFTPDYVREFYGVDPIQIIDRKAIEGDASDNIPGVKGVGEKSVIPLLQEFETVEGIYDFLESHTEVEASKFMKSLGIRRSPYKALMEEAEDEYVGKEAVMLSKRLATIITDMPELQSVTLEDLALQINEVGQRRVFERLEFNSLLESLSA